MFASILLWLFCCLNKVEIRFFNFLFNQTKKYFADIKTIFTFVKNFKMKLTILITLSIWLINNVNAVTAYFSYAAFFAPEHGTYIETYLAIDPSSVAYKINSNNKLQSIIEVAMLFKKDGEIRDFRKYSVSSPEIDKTIKTMPYGFIDLQRITIPNGIYNFEMLLRDEFAEDSAIFKHNELMTVMIYENKMSFSDVQPVENFTPTTDENQFSKSGIDVIPYVSNFYPKNINKLSFYAELYNSDKEIGKDSIFLIKYFISSSPSRRIFEKFSLFDRKKAAQVVVIAKTIDIKDLPSGNYNLEIEIRNKNNELLLLKKYFFQRSNNIAPEDAATDFSSVITENSWVEKYSTVHELAPLIKSLYPIAGRVERNFIEKDFKASDIKMMQQFFLNFWESRNSVASENEWDIYNRNVQHVNRRYGNQVKRGYQTDRGRIYLLYGVPDLVIKRENMSHYLPYEVWHYYQADSKTNRRFVFSLMNIGTQDYDLIHSNMEGEMRNESWIDMLRNNKSRQVEDNTSIYDEYRQLILDFQN